MPDLVAEARRLHDDQRYAEGVDLLAATAFKSLSGDSLEIPDDLREVLEDCCFTYLMQLSEAAGLGGGYERPMESWIRALADILPPERHDQEKPRLAVVAVAYLLNMVAHRDSLASDFPDILASASAFVLSRMLLAGRLHAVLAFAPRVLEWLSATGGSARPEVASVLIRVHRDRLIAAQELNLCGLGDTIFAEAQTVAGLHPHIWPQYAAAIFGRYALLLASCGQGGKTLAMADRAVAEALEEDRAYAQSIRMKLRRRILGEEPDYAELMEAIVPGGAKAVDEVRALMARLDSGQPIAPGELSSIAQRIAALHQNLAADPTYAQATLDVRVKLALSSGNRDLVRALRPEMAALAERPGRKGIEARALSLALDALADGVSPADEAARLIEEASSRVAGLEALLVNRVLFKLVSDHPDGPALEAYARWLFHLADSLAEATGWGDRRRLMEETKWWFPEVELATFAALSLSELAEESEPFLRLALRLFSAGHAVAARTDPALREAAGRLLQTAEGRAAFDSLAQAVAEGDAELAAEAREALLASLPAIGDIPRSPAGSDYGDQPQLLYVETRAFLSASTPIIRMVDTLSDVLRHVEREEVEPLRDLVDAVFDPVRLRFNKAKTATLGGILVPHLSHMLPPAFGIRGSGLIQAVPFAALPASDGVVVGEVAVPVLLTGPDSRLEAVTDPFETGGAVLVVADPEYGEDGPTRLPGSAEEAAAIRCHLDGRMEVMLLTGFEANRANLLRHLRTDPPKIIHLAVHGIGTADDPALTHVQLAGGEAVTFDDVALLDLSGVDLVVLGACSTMRGRIRRGEGVLALAWAFRAAGARAVISTRWDVDDLASALYWGRFYEVLAAKGSICTAMQAAGDALRAHEDFFTPRHWAAYQLMV